MAHPGDFELSGILYVGTDFDTWSKKTDALLRVNDALPESLLDRTPMHMERAKSIILRLVDPTIISRIADDVRMGLDIPRLHQSLRQLSRPFGFMDLPKELRLKVYNALPDMQSYRSLDMPLPNPTIFGVSHLVQQETNPLFYSSTTFGIQYNLTPPLKDTLRAWVGRAPVGVMQNLRSFRFNTMVYHTVIQFNFSVTNGLTYEGGHEFTAESNRRLQQAVDRLEVYRTVTSMRGEILLLAILEANTLRTAGRLHRI